MDCPYCKVPLVKKEHFLDCPKCQYSLLDKGQEKKFFKEMVVENPSAKEWDEDAEITDTGGKVILSTVSSRREMKWEEFDEEFIKPVLEYKPAMLGIAV